MGHGLAAIPMGLWYSSSTVAAVHHGNNFRITVQRRQQRHSCFSIHSLLLSPLWTLALLLLTVTLVRADCECGYSANIGQGNNVHQHLFTDLVESNFAKLKDVTKNTDWVRQEFNLTAVQAAGPYGEIFGIDNVVTSDDDYRGMDLYVRNNLVNGMVPVAEVDTYRLDMGYGTFRASMKLSNIPGTCAAFFWYFNDTQEIDMEFLTKDFNPSNKSYPIHLVLQSLAAQQLYNNAALTDSYIKTYLPFDPTDDFHEYRFDYIPDHVYFYADGILLGEINGSVVPTSPGHLILRHWSNGNPKWSGGPPPEDAPLEIRYVKGYFNSTEPQRSRDWQSRCTNPSTSKAVCEIPSLNPRNLNAGNFFFSDNDNMTPNQTVYDPDAVLVSGTSGLGRGPEWLSVIVSFLLVSGLGAMDW